MPKIRAHFLPIRQYFRPFKAVARALRTNSPREITASFDTGRQLLIARCAASLCRAYQRLNHSMRPAQNRDLFDLILSLC